MESNRANSFLRLIQCSQRGKLKIYLGYCAGVGKTWQMLQEARRLNDNGIDVVVGFVETHKSKETETLLAELEILPRKSQLYLGIEITEMDIDAIHDRSGNPSPVALDLVRGAVAWTHQIPGISTLTGVHRRDQHEAGGVGQRHAGAGNRHLPVLQRLPE